MTYSQLIKTLAKKLDLKSEEVAILWREANHILTKELAHHNKVRIKNFGAFVVVKHKSRTVPDPREMTKKIVIFDQFLPKFRPSEQLRAIVKSVKPLATLEEVEVASEEAPLKTEVKSTSQEASKLDQSILKATAKTVNIGYADLSNLTIDKAILDLIPFHLAKKYQLVPMEKKDDRLIVAMIDPGDKEAIDLIARQTGLSVEPKITTLADLNHALDQYGSISSELGEITEQETEPVKTPAEADEEVEDNDAPAIKIVTNLLERAVREKASDIHFEPEEKKVIIRFRIDGLLQNVLELPKNLQASVTARVKIMSNLKIDESRLPQDGRIRLVIDSTPIDFRLSTLPTVNGEKIVMRILDKSSGVLSFKELGLAGNNLLWIKDNIKKAHGMTLVTGPTGSGKTTTLYAVIGKIMSPTINIMTLEDPVEYRIPGINQSQVNSAIKFDFASGLRSIVRQDPDVILIGEIRDLETANMAVHSALTGHVVLSTLHTNDAAGAIPRLIDMGIEPFLITSSTNAVVAQRLVRKLCDNCRVKVSLPAEALGEVNKELSQIPAASRPKDASLTFYQGKGCDQCGLSGYRGRIGIFEVLSVSESIKQLILKRVSSSDLARQAISDGMITLKQDGLLKALAGVTTLEEVWRVTKD